VRKAKMMHRTNSSTNESRSIKNGKRQKSNASMHTNGQAPPGGTSPMGYESTIDGVDGEPLLLHPSVLPDAPDPLEPQLLFLRGAAFLQHAVHLIESAILKLEEIRKVLSVDGAELRLCYIENGKYGGVEIGNPDGPLGKKIGPKVKAYGEVLGEKGFKEQITGLLKKSIRDHEKHCTPDRICIPPLREHSPRESQQPSPSPAQCPGDVHDISPATRGVTF
jgi:hypothetical protein